MKKINLVLASISPILYWLFIAIFVIIIAVSIYIAYDAYVRKKDNEEFTSIVTGSIGMIAVIIAAVIMKYIGNAILGEDIWTPIMGTISISILLFVVQALVKNKYPIILGIAIPNIPIIAASKSLSDYSGISAKSLIVVIISSLIAIILGLLFDKILKIIFNIKGE